MTDPLSRLLGQTDGWGGVQEIEANFGGQRPAEVDDPQARLAEHVAQTFAGEAGRATLQYLVDRTLMHQAVPDLGDPNLIGLGLEGLTASVIWHEARRHLVRELMQLMEQGAAPGADDA